jgi:broad specificity phosphatase PhoE
MTDLLRPLLVLLAMVAACDSVATSESGTDRSFSLYLVRHAEKQADSDDPGLTIEGRARAEFFARWMQDKNIRAIWSSDYRRTLETARPAADRLQLEVGLYDPRNQQALADQLLESGVNALVVGHSNTVPELATLLCGCHIDAMEHTDYDRAFVVHVGNAGVRVDETNLAALRSGSP